MSADVISPISAEKHRHHRDVTGGWLRPAVFGGVDGLVSNFALISGVVGGGAPNTFVVVTGLAGLVAGACAVGAALPILPFLLGASGLLIAAILSVAGLLLAGGMVARLTARPWWTGALRQLLLGGFAAVVTFGIGSLVGTGLS